jgi:hypothetical protein
MGKPVAILSEGGVLDLPERMPVCIQNPHYSADRYDLN